MAWAIARLLAQVLVLRLCRGARLDGLEPCQGKLRGILTLSETPRNFERQSRSTARYFFVLGSREVSSTARDLQLYPILSHLISSDKNIGSLVKCVFNWICGHKSSLTIAYIEFNLICKILISEQ